MERNRIPFGMLPDGTLVEELILRDGEMSCHIITYGGAIRSLLVPDRDGNPVDVALGFDTLEDYCVQDKYIGALIGRFGNRIGGAKFPLNGKEYPVAANDGVNHLHGGLVGFDKQVWSVDSQSANQVVLSLVSPDGQEGYPGTLKVTVTYTLASGALSISYRATSDQDTLCNLTNHCYFNLAGHASGPVGAQTVQLLAARYTPTDSGSIPTGELADVAGTPMDLRTPTPMGDHWDDDFEQLTLAGGYDHNWVLDGEAGVLRTVARASAPATGITMEVDTTCPGIQFYSGNYLMGCPAGKGGAPYDKRWGFCLETQIFPDAPHHPNCPPALLPAGDTYAQETVYRYL